MRMDTERPLKCNFINNSIVLEIIVVTLILLSGLAITGEILITYKLITVPQNAKATSNVNSTNITSNEGGGSYVSIENTYAVHILVQVFHYSSIGIAGLFFLEISLKVCALRRKFLGQPWQIFDTVVVLATFGVELAFHFIDFHPQAIYAVTYIVMLRLWRVPVLCRTRVNQVKESSEKDAELHIYRNTSADEKDIWLENTLSQQAETIRKLEGMIHYLKASKSNDISHATAHANTNGHIHHPTQRTNYAFDVQNKSSLPDSVDMISKSHQERNLLNDSKQNESLFEVKINASETSQAKKRNTLVKSASDIKDVSYIEKTQKYKKVYENEIGNFNHRFSTKTPAKYDLDLVDEVDEMVKKSRSLPPAVTLYHLMSSSSQTNHVPWKLRKRRSSTSEIVDYGNLNSKNMDSVFSEDSNKYTSCPSLDLENESETSTKTVQKHGFMDKVNITNKAVEKNLSSMTYSESEVNSVQSSEQKQNSGRNRLRRLSCPEYVYTQRMSITNDESMLIGDDRSIQDPTTYDNMGLDYNFRLHVLAEFDGTETYRNEDGIPMTSL